MNSYFTYFYESVSSVCGILRDTTVDICENVWEVEYKLYMDEGWCMFYEIYELVSMKKIL